MIDNIEDSMFALILRFVGFNQEISFHNQEFLKKQLKEIKEHIRQFPSDEQGLRAIKWIEQYADEYRKTWNKKIVAKKFSNHRCPDCPLCDDNVLEHCQIHNQWLELMQKYVTEYIDSQEYVDSTLKLLTDHKEHLKIKLCMLSLQQRYDRMGLG